MAVFAVEAEPDPTIVNFFIDTNRRLQGNNLLRNPFVGGIFWPGEGNIFVFVMDPIWPRFFYFGWLWAIGAIVLGVPLAWVWPGVVIGCLGFFWSGAFMYIMLRIAIKKAGYKDRVRMVKLADVFRVYYTLKSFNQKLNLLSNDSNFCLMPKRNNKTEVLEDG